MALTRPFAETVQARIRNSKTYGHAVLCEAINLLLEGDVQTAKGFLRDYINATAGFGRLAKDVKIPSKSLMRMFGPNGNPQAKNLFAVIAALQKHAGIEIHAAAE